MKALAKIEGGEAVHVEEIAATGACGGGYEEYGDDKGNEPDTKDHCRGPVRTGQREGGPDRRHIDEDHTPQKPAPFPYYLQTRRDCGIIRGCMFFQVLLHGFSQPARFSLINP